MSTISSIDSSIYSGLIDSLSAYTPRRDALESAASKTPAVSGSEADSVDLSSYYSGINEEELLSDLGENVAKAAEDFDNAMVSALENGFSVNDAVNIHQAKAAYQANCALFNSVTEMQNSTFELMV